MSHEPEPLRRELSRLAIAVLAINGLVGAGIFGLPAEAAKHTGAFSPVIFILCGVMMGTVILSFAQASSYFHGTGGPILYTRTAFGPFVGFQTGWCIYVGRATSLAANANLLATYLGTFVPGADEGPGRIAVIVAIAVFFTVVNVVGVRRGMGSVMAISVIKFIPLVLFVLVGLAFVDPARFAGAAAPPAASLGEAILLVLYAFIGFEGALVPAGEARNPKRDMPRALIAAALAATILYVLIQTVAVGVLPDLASSKRPLADAAAAMVGVAGAYVISAGAVISILGNYAASALSAPRMTYALARDGMLPRWFGRVHERFRTPHLSVVFYCGLAVALGLTGTFAGLAIMSSLARLLGYAACIATVPFLKRRFPDEEAAMRLPGGLAIPIAALAVCAYLVAQVRFEAVWKTALLIALGSVLYVSTRKIISPKETT